jgi:hypothetical protein
LEVEVVSEAMVDSAAVVEEGSEVDAEVSASKTASPTTLPWVRVVVIKEATAGAEVDMAAEIVAAEIVAAEIAATIVVHATTPTTSLSLPEVVAPTAIAMTVAVAVAAEAATEVEADASGPTTTVREEEEATVGMTAIPAGHDTRAYRSDSITDTKNVSG